MFVKRIENEYNEMQYYLENQFLMSKYCGFLLFTHTTNIISIVNSYKRVSVNNNFFRLNNKEGHNSISYLPITLRSTKLINVVEIAASTAHCLLNTTTEHCPLNTEPLPFTGIFLLFKERISSACEK